MLIIVLLVVILGFIIGLPIVFILAGASLAYFVADPLLPNTMVSLRMVVGTESYSLLAIPLFMLAGNIMNGMGLTKRIFKFSQALVGHFTGGTAYMNILASFIFSGMSGSALADASGIGSVLIKAMKDEGYDSEFSASVTAASATIGPIFPPSVPLVLFGSVASISVGKLFVGGIVPGILLAIYMTIVVYVLAKKRNYPRSERVSFSQLASFTLTCLPALTTPVVILGGILGGFFTPTEAGVVAVIYTLFIASVFYRETSFKALFEMLISTAIDTAKIMVIVGGAYALAWVLSKEQIGLHLTNIITILSTNPTIVLLLILSAFIVAGCFLNPTANIIIFVPLLMPLVKRVGIDPIHFGVVSTLTLMLGLMTPPLGLSMFIVCDLAKISIMQFVRGMKWFYLAIIALIVTIVLIPQIVTFLPELLM